MSLFAVCSNCIDDDPVYYNSREWSKPDVGLTKRWGPAVQYHVGFKWLWLNRGRTELPIDIQVIFDPQFADQRFATEHSKRSDPPETVISSTDAFTTPDGPYTTSLASQTSW